MQVFPSMMLTLLIVSLVLCCMGFYKFVYFMSVGYGLAVAGEGVTLLVFGIIRGQIGIPFAILCVLLIIYGCRLGLFLLIRELKSAAYKKTLDSQTDKKMPLFLMIIMWICVAALYVAQVSPLVYQISNETVTMSGSIACWIGAVITAVGVIMEALADKQKSASKKLRPDMVAMTGLYKICRCPNYFGEILVWTGVFISGIGAVSGLQWIMAVFGYVCIVYIMFSGAKRLEKRQNKNYGDKEEYREYANKTPIIIPLIPLYHLVKEEK